MMRSKKAADREPEAMGLNVLAEASECLKTLAHPHRLRMAEMLLRGRYTVGELAKACSISSPMASGHLRLLQHCGLVDHQREGARSSTGSPNPA